MTGSNVLPEKDLLEKAPIVKRFEYWHLDKLLKVKTYITKKKKKKKQYQRLDNTFDFGKTIKNEKPTLKIYNRSNIAFINIAILKILIVFLLCQIIHVYSRSIVN